MATMEANDKHIHKDAGQQQPENDGNGRLYNSQNPSIEKNATQDISQVDQQEGTMKNGESGGNFSPDEARDV